jgi:cytochrome c
MKGTGRMMGSRHDRNLKSLESNKRVKAITYCRDPYRVTTADGKTRAWGLRSNYYSARLKSDLGFP